MYCGSCLRDNRLAATLIGQGRDVTLIPLYTPLRTDERDASTPRILYGGINVFLQQRAAWLPSFPAVTDRLLDARWLLRAASRWAARTRPEDVGDLTVSVLRGEDGAQARELDKLVRALRGIPADLINLPNLMFVGVTRRLREEFKLPIVCTLGGEDLFLNALTEPYRTHALDLIRTRAADVDAFVAVTRYFASHSAKHFHLPSERVHYVPMGIGVDDLSVSDPPPHRPFTIGYLARICPEKGLDNIARAFVALRRRGRACRLHVAGYLGSADRKYFNRVAIDLRNSGFSSDVEFVGEVTRRDKLRFLEGLHVLSVPTVYPEAKGFYVLEALACGVPVVQPSHGSFPELIDQTGGGLLCPPGDPEALADEIASLMDDEALRRKLGANGRDAVRRSFSNTAMADQTWALYERLCERHGRLASTP
jgi:glycosyltransferase involved in cell wall biosynthesis